MADRKINSNKFVNADARAALRISKGIIAGNFGAPGSETEDRAISTAMQLWQASHIARREVIKAQVPAELDRFIEVSIPWMPIDSEIGKMLWPRGIKRENERRAAVGEPLLSVSFK